MQSCNQPHPSDQTPSVRPTDRTLLAGMAWASSLPLPLPLPLPVTGEKANQNRRAIVGIGHCELLRYTHTTVQSAFSGYRVRVRGWGGALRFAQKIKGVCRRCSEGPEFFQRSRSVSLFVQLSNYEPGQVRVFFTGAVWTSASKLSSASRISYLFILNTHHTCHIGPNIYISEFNPFRAIFAYCQRQALTYPHIVSSEFELTSLAARRH